MSSPPTDIDPAAARVTHEAMQAAAAAAGLRLDAPRQHRRRDFVTPILLGVLLIGIFGFVAGWRLVVVRSGSMGERVPTGSLVIAAPTSGDSIEVGDLLVMQRPDAATVTHEVIDITSDGGRRVAVTKGAANPDADPIPYPLDGNVLTSRASLPGVGFALQIVRANLLSVVLVIMAAIVVLRPLPAPPPTIRVSG